MSAVRNSERPSVRLTIRALNEIQTRRDASRDALLVMKADHQRQREMLCAIFDEKHLHRRDCLGILKQIDDEIGVQTSIIEGLALQIEAMGTAE